MVNPKHLFFSLFLAVAFFHPAYGQRFTKREQARREARAANYFYGASFTAFGGYVHSWALQRRIYPQTVYFGQRSMLQDNHDAFDIGMTYDQALSRQWGIQVGLFYNEKGCDKVSYYDNGLGYGYNRYSAESQRIPGIELQGQMRYFIPIEYYSRLSVGAGLYVNRFVDSPSDFKDWDLGIQVSLGYDWKHLSVAATYQPGVFPKVADHCYTRLGAVTFNVGYRFWRK